MKDCLNLLRISHWLKNALIFLPLIFGRKLTDPALLLRAVAAFFLFGLVTSAVYIFNDLRDADMDRRHSTKKNRPIASGRVSTATAIRVALLLLALAVGMSLWFSFSLAANLWLLLYLLLNLAYTLKLKTVPILDVATLAIGFLLRVLYGSAVVDTPISGWLYLTVLTVSFYMALGKRKKEIDYEAENTRPVLQYYNKAFLDKNMYLCAALAIAFYSLWCIDLSNSIPYSMVTVPLVLLICMRYSLDIETGADGDPIPTILSDKWLLLLLTVYVLLILSLIYLWPLVF